MKIKLENWKWGYNRPYLPHKWWKFESLFDKMNWDPNLYPGYLSALKEAFDNAMVFLTPWYRSRRRLLQSFVNPNGGKLLWNTRKAAQIRTRGETIIYYNLNLGLFTAKLTKLEYIDEESGESCNMFLEAVAEVFGGKDEGKITEKEEVFNLGLCLTDKQCQKALDKAVEVSPELGWFQYEEATENTEDVDNEKQDEN